MRPPGTGLSLGLCWLESFEGKGLDADRRLEKGEWCRVHRKAGSRELRVSRLDWMESPSTRWTLLGGGLEPACRTVARRVD